MTLILKYFPFLPLPHLLPCNSELLDFISFFFFFNSLSGKSTRNIFGSNIWSLTLVSDTSPKTFVIFRVRGESFVLSGLLRVNFLVVPEREMVPRKNKL